MGSWNTEDQPRRQGVLRRPREEVGERARPLGQRRTAGPALEILTAGGRQGGPGPQGDARPRRRHRAHTILGKIRFVGSENVGTPGTVSQWQKGEFEVVWPKALATATLVRPSRPGNRRRDRSTPGAEASARRCPVGAWVELIASGLITGGIYALVAIGLNLQYGLMRILNIAHGEFLMLGAFLTWARTRASASRRC